MNIKTISKYVKQAKSWIGQRGKLEALLSQSRDKEDQVGSDPPTGLFDALKRFRRMVEAQLWGDYPISTKTLVYLVAGLLYFINPFDIVPDFIAGLGYVDDASVLFWISKQVKREMEDFEKHSVFRDIE